MKELEIKSSTVEQAIAQGLQELGVTENEVNIEIIQKGGFLKKATVKLSLKDAATQVAPTAKTPIVEAKADETPQNDSTTIEQTNTQAENITNESQDNQYIKPRRSFKETPYDQLDNGDKTCVDFLKSLIKAMGLDCYLKVTASHDKLCILIAGKDTETIIGFRGETLDNIQYLSLLVANKTTRYRKKLIIDAEGYREKRAEVLANLSKNIALKVARTNCAVELEPMNAFERRVIHTALQDHKDVITSSEGEEPNRYVVISPRGEAPADMYDNSAKQSFKKSGIGKTRSFGAKNKRF